MIAHPTEELSTAELLIVVSGPALYLLAHALFRLRMAGTISWKRLAGAVACLAVALVGSAVSALVVSALVVAVLVVVIAAEQVAGARRQRRGEPSALERLEQSAAP